MWTKIEPYRCKEPVEWPIDRQKENEFLNRHFTFTVFATSGFFLLLVLSLGFLFIVIKNPFGLSDFWLCMIAIGYGIFPLASFWGWYVGAIVRIICPCCGRRYILGFRYSGKYTEQCANCGHPGLHNV